MIGVDTNVLVRYFAEDDAAQVALARRLLERDATPDDPVRVGSVVLAETAWVLQSRYFATRDEIADVLDELLTDPRVNLQDEAAVAVAAHEFATSNADFSDLLISAINTLHGCRTTLTFDKQAAKVAGMALLR
ncbi:MAG TPA: type II toxin-antitoxin system VapC family toxin [Caldimonas sp.]|nr:type II toxin-antitoxin system VapC family toxin [Caldimonas sp.]